MRLLALSLVAAALACGKDKPAAPAPAPPAEAAAPKPAAAPPAPAEPAPAEPAPAAEPEAPAAPPTARPGGPTVEACEKTADHLKSLVVGSVDNATPKERAYVARLIDQDRAAVVGYCLEIAVVKEIECVLAAKAVGDLAGCERMRREVTPALAEARELTYADCARFFDRLRQFKLAEGISPESIDKDREQIIRTCQEKANPGTVTCFIASPTYEQARRCP